MISTYVVFDRVGYPQKYPRNGPVRLQDLANLPTSVSIELELTSANARSAFSLSQKSHEKGSRNGGPQSEYTDV